MPKFVTVFIGGVGDGKSTSSNQFCARLGSKPNQFSESARGFAHTAKPKQVTVGDFIVVDTPGLLDTDGDDKDIRNLRTIVNYLKDFRYVNSFVLVVNFLKRFDHGLQNAMNIFVRSFGKGFLNNLAILYTNCPTNKGSLARRTDDIRRMINRACGTAIGHLPYYYMDCHPEERAEDDVPKARIAQYRVIRNNQMDDLRRWVMSRPKYSMKFTEYINHDAKMEKVFADRERQRQQEAYAEQRRQQRQAQLRAQQQEYRREQQRLEEERRRSAAAAEARRKDSTVSSSYYETRERQTDCTQTPHYVEKREYYKRPARSIWGLFGHTKTESRWVKVQRGYDTRTTYQTERRLIKTYESGRVEYGNWEYLSSRTVNS